jgi:hypothetical protein
MVLQLLAKIIAPQEQHRAVAQYRTCRPNPFTTGITALIDEGQDTLNDHAQALQNE